MMKKILLLTFIFSQSFLLFSQGPDQFGYTFLTSNDSLGPSYQWFDITRKGALIQNLGDDNFSIPIPVSSFYFYSTQPSNFYVGSNGYIAFSPTNIASMGGSFPAIPSPAKPNGFIAPLLCDLTFAGNNNPAKAYYYDKGDTICISFLKVPFWVNNAQGFGGENSFQVILNKADNSITFNYLAQNGYPNLTYTTNGLSIGIENSTGTDGLQYYRGDTFPSPYSTVKYYYPKNPKSITDAKLNWINNTDNGGEFIGMQDTIRPSVNVKNIGNNNIDSSFTITYQIRDSSRFILLANSITVDSLAAGRDSTKHLPPFSPPYPGRFSIAAEISGVAKDSVPNNDKKEVLLVALDTFKYMQSLTYASKSRMAGGISWVGGNAGVGVYIKPPFYPARIDVVNFYILRLGGANGFKWALYDDKGRGSIVGNIIDSNSVSSMQLSPNAYFGDTIKSKNIIIKSGGVFLSWIMDGDGIMLGKTMPRNTPASRRAYEVIGNDWAPYRSIETEDFMLHIDISDPSITEPAPNIDVELSWINNSDNGGEFVTISDTIKPTVKVKNIGNTKVDSSFTISYEYKDSSNVVLQTGDIIIDSLASGDDSTKQLPSFSPPFPGRFSITAEVNGITKDTTAINDSKNALIVALDTFKFMQSLSYASKYNMAGSISWPSRNAGVGVYIKPPFYPARIDVANFYIQHFGQAKNFKWILYDDSGRGNTPRKVLDSNTVNTIQLKTNSYYRDTIKNKNIIINSGGVYLTWIMNGDGISLGTSMPANTPTSRRTYEVFGGLWAPYRAIETEDFMMHIDISDPTITGVETQALKVEKLLVYPNPSKYATEIMYNKNILKWKDLKVYDLSGKRYFPKIEETVNGLRLYKGEMSNGIYIIQMGELRNKLIFID